MKKYLIAIGSIVVLYFCFDYLYFHAGWYIPTPFAKEVESDTYVDDKNIYFKQGKDYKPFEIKGVDLGSGKPGAWSTDFAIDKKTYLRWFKQIQKMGANTIRVYTVQQDVFYDALYEYNKERKNPLYLLQGVWVNDYIQNSHVDAFDASFKDEFQKNCYTMINVIHGNCKINLGEMASSGMGSYNRDISEWVLGYILGVEWEDVTVAYTNEKFQNDPKHCQYKGRFMSTTKEAKPFEAFLAEIGDHVISYESDRYRQQRLIAFSNWPTTDPFDYEERVANFFMKCAKVDVEHIRTTDKFKSGQFASYHVYPYYPDYLNFLDDWSDLGIKDKQAYQIEAGKYNTYRAYLQALTNYHKMPVVISEFGVSTGRGMAQKDQNTGRNQGNMSEQEQGKAIVDCYQDIMAAGCAGCCIFTWQDEWFKRTWNTMYAVDLKQTPYWSDYQTNEQYFGLLSFDPGKKKSICYVDGDFSEWNSKDVILKNGDTRLSMKYDEKFVYFYVKKKGFDINNDTLYIPIDTTSKSGSKTCKDTNLNFKRPADFLLTINGRDNSRVQVQEYYESLRANYSDNAYGYNTYYTRYLPAVDSPLFLDIQMILQTATPLLQKDNQAKAETYETGKLTYGNANPNSKYYNSLADFMAGEDGIEIKLPWQILNFACPSEMEIHDDYYNGNYGVDYIKIDNMYVGVGDVQKEGQIIPFGKLPLKAWGKDVTYHERLKSSYEIVKELWTNSKASAEKSKK